MGFLEEKVAAVVSAAMPPRKPAVEGFLPVGGADAGGAGASSHPLLAPAADVELDGLLPTLGSELFESLGLSLRRGLRS